MAPAVMRNARIEKVINDQWAPSVGGVGAARVGELAAAAAAGRPPAFTCGARRAAVGRFTLIVRFWVGVGDGTPAASVSI